MKVYCLHSGLYIKPPPQVPDLHHRHRHDQQRLKQRPPLHARVRVLGCCKRGREKGGREEEGEGERKGRRERERERRDSRGKKTKS